jgi:hypothetical protein
VSSAEPVSPVPPVVPFGSPYGLFDVPGCPACRHVAEASEEYLAWLAQDGYRNADVLARLTASRGMCAAHTRRLLAVPGASAGLVVVYRQVIDAAVGDSGAASATCPGCDQDAIAADRLFEYLLGEATRGDRRTYKQHGGLCVPHLRGAAVARRGADILWLIRFMIVRLTAPSPSLELLAGHADEAGQPVRPGPSHEEPAMCVVCSAGVEAARAELEVIAECLCAQHLRDAVRTAGCRPAELLTEQAALHAARLAQVVDGRARSLGNYLSVRARRALADPDCPVCRSFDAACARTVARAAGVLREPRSASSARPSLCLRHAGDVLAVNPHAGRIAHGYLRESGQQLLGQLTAAGEWGAAERLTGSIAPLMTAVRRAAVFLDGSTFGVAPAATPPGSGLDREVRLRYTPRRRGSP